VLGDDLGELLGARIPGDHSRQTIADDYARPAEHVLDLGCGAGDSVDLFRSVDPNVAWVGADIEDSAEVAARTRGDAEFVTFDGRRLPFDDGAFDLVYCKQVLEHVEHPRELVAEAARVLRPGGRLAIADIISASPLNEATRRNTELWAACIAGAIPTTAYLDELVAAGFALGDARRNTYEFVSDRAVEACRTYGVESLSIVARRLS
jgi:arsenite methyltransferase